jgi:hypothetical protein
VLIVGAAEGTRDKSVLERQAQPLWESSDRGHGVRRSWPDPREAGKPNFVPLGCARSIDRIGLAVPGAALIKGGHYFSFYPRHAPQPSSFKAYTTNNKTRSTI